MESRNDDLTLAWHEAQAQLPRGWTLDSLRCASTGLAVHLRSDDWVAVAVGPHGQHTEHRAADPVSALGGLSSAVARSQDA